MSELWQIVDRRNGRPYGATCYLKREHSERQISEWQDRHDRGRRPDITREMLLNMVPAKVH